MAEYRKFRGAFNGFNREDVVGYIAQMNYEHKSELTKRDQEISQLRAELEALRGHCVEAGSALKEAEARNRELERQLETERCQAQTDGELKAYRRAERAERLAGEQVEKLRRETAEALELGAACAEDAMEKAEAAAEQVLRLLEQLKGGLASGAGELRKRAEEVCRGTDE